MSSNDRPVRVMWLLNHTSARKFELPMFRRCGIQEIFTPKILPADVTFRSASVDFSDDSSLTIPEDDLHVLNAQNWYDVVSDEAMEIANRHFDIAFFITHDPRAVSYFSRKFNGVLVCRAYGLPETLSYSYLIKTFFDPMAVMALNRKNSFFFFAPAYKQILDAENSFITRNTVFLPLGLIDAAPRNDWKGVDPRILFVCPDIAYNGYYRDIYEKFRTEFEGFDYLITGAQPVKVPDPRVTGFLSATEYARCMREMRLMFYHSREPRHVHYHPFEAIRAGMPLLFMSGGILDDMGGNKLPGRCRTISEAKKKATRLLNGDPKFSDEIRLSQLILLERMKAELLESDWRRGIQKLRETVLRKRSEAVYADEKKKFRRIAVILPVGYRGGSLRAALMVCEAIALGAVQDNTNAEVVFCHLESEQYEEDQFRGLPENVVIRTFKWRMIDRVDAQRAMRLNGNPLWEPAYDEYLVPDDGMRELSDCDLWCVISDRLLKPLLQLRPVCLMVYDYLQRYAPSLIFQKNSVSDDKSKLLLEDRKNNSRWLRAARDADTVFVTTKFTEQDALQYGGLARNQVRRLPMLLPRFEPATNGRFDVSVDDAGQLDEYFIWTTNASPHKNHNRAFGALQRYYEKLGGRLKCVVTGVNTEKIEFFNPRNVGTEKIRKSDHKKNLPGIKRRFISNSVDKNVFLLGELSDDQYQNCLQNARFLWHPALIDNGTFSVVEAARLSVPSLSSRYPAMTEMDEEFDLNLSWMDPMSVEDMADALKKMEIDCAGLRERLPDRSHLDKSSPAAEAVTYWRALAKLI